MVGMNGRMISRRDAEAQRMAEDESWDYPVCQRPGRMISSASLRLCGRNTKLEFHGWPALRW